MAPRINLRSLPQLEMLRVVDAVAPRRWSGEGRLRLVFRMLELPWSPALGWMQVSCGGKKVKASLADKRAPGLGKAGTGGVAFRLLRLVGRPQPYVRSEALTERVQSNGSAAPTPLPCAESFSRKKKLELAGERREGVKDTADSPSSACRGQPKAESRRGGGGRRAGQGSNQSLGSSAAPLLRSRACLSVCGLLRWSQLRPCPVPAPFMPPLFLLFLAAPPSLPFFPSLLGCCRKNLACFPASFGRLPRDCRSSEMHVCSQMHTRAGLPLPASPWPVGVSRALPLSPPLPLPLSDAFGG